MKLAVVMLAMFALPAATAQPETTSREELSAVMRLRPDLQHGSALFASCAACHGRDGSGLPDGIVPAIGGQHARVIAKQLIDYRHANRWDPNMEDVVEKHGLGDPQAIADVATYIASLGRGGKSGQGSGEHLDSGGQLFTRDCARCHGASAGGSDVLGIPRLAGQNYSYLLRQFHDTLEHRRPDMPDPHRRLLADLDAAALTGLADYLSRLPFSTPAR